MSPNNFCDAAIESRRLNTPTKAEALCSIFANKMAAVIETNNKLTVIDGWIKIRNVRIKHKRIAIK